MSGRDALAGGPRAEPPSKRRRVDDDSVDTTPRYGSPDQVQDQKLSIRRRRPPSRSRSRSQSSQGSRSRSRNPSRAISRSRSPSYSHSGSPSRSRSRSRSLQSGRSRSRTSSSSRSRSLSGSSSRHSSQEPQSRLLSQSASQPPLPTDQRKQPLKPRYRPRLALRGHTAAISQVRISPDGRWIASASADGTVKIWDAETGAHLDTLVGHMAGVSCVAWAPDSGTLATGSDDKAIRLWDRVTANPAHACGDGWRADKATRGGKTGRGPLLGHHNYVYCLAFSPKGNILASGSYDEAVFLWDVRAGRLMRSLPAHSDPVSGIDFCRDGTLVVSCSTDGLIRVWDTSTGQCLRTLVHEDNPAVTNVCFSPNGRFVLAFSLDSSIRLWDYVSGAVKKTYQGHKNKGFSIGGCFGELTEAEDGENADSPDGAGSGRRSQSFVASASEDGDIVLWDVKSKEVVQRITGAHKGVCFWVDVNGHTMVSAGQDGMIKIFRDNNLWRLREGQEREDGKALNGINGVNGHGGITDDELQRQIGEEAGSPLPHVKEEQL